MAGEPARIPAAARARIEQERVRAERRLTVADAEPAELTSFRGGGVVRLHPGHDQVVPAVVSVIAVIVESLSDAARLYAWTADRLHAAVNAESDDVTAWVYNGFGWFGPVTLAEFRREVARTVRDERWWRAYLDMREERSVAVIPFHRHLKAVIDELGWTPDQFAERTGVDRTNVYNHLDGTARPHPKTVTKYEDVLSAALGWPITFVLPPKSSRTTRTT